MCNSYCEDKDCSNDCGGKYDGGCCCGKPGPRGPMGPMGPCGCDGKHGHDGKDGRNGHDGKDGRNAEFNICEFAKQLICLCKNQRPCSKCECKHEPECDA